MKIKNLLIHKTKFQVLFKFLALLTIFIAYFIYLSIKFDLATGSLVAVLTWSFFVLATPIMVLILLIEIILRKTSKHLPMLGVYAMKIYTILKPGKKFAQYDKDGNLLTTLNEDLLLDTIAYYKHAANWRNNISRINTVTGESCTK